MGHFCKNCKKRIDITNLRNLCCRNCKNFFHPKCVKVMPPLKLKRRGLRFQVIRNENFECENCVLQQLPFYDMANSQLLDMIPKSQNVFPSANELNDLFLEETRCEDDFEIQSYSNECKYFSSHDMTSLSFIDEIETMSEFPIISLNIRSIVNRNNFAKFEALLEKITIKPMVIALTETWINDSSSGPYSNIKGYNFVQNNRKKCNGGGVAFYVADHIHFTKNDNLSIMKEKSFESLFLDVEVGGKTIVCGSVYRSPNSNHTIFNQNLNEILRETSKLNKKMILMGDLNYNLLNTDDLNVSGCVDTFFEFGFFPLINIPTRVTEKTASVLDHIWTNMTDIPTKSGVLADPISDHLPVFLNLGVERSNDFIKIQKRNFSEKNLKNFNCSLDGLKGDDILKEKSTNVSYNLFMNRYLKIFEEAFPVETKEKMAKVRFSNPWYTKELHNLDLEKENNYSKFMKNRKNNLLKTTYNKSRNLYYRAVRMTKIQYFQNNLIKVKNDVKGTWNIINSVLGRKKGKQLFKLKIDDEEIKNETKIANKFNDYFSNVADNLVKRIPVKKSRKRFNEYLGKKNTKSLFLNPTDPIEIVKILKSLKSKTSSGWDNVPQKVIKRSPLKVVIILSHIFNLSMSEGVFPEKMKLAKVIPIFKKGSKLDVSNYRPISLLPVFSKILERLVYNRLNSFLKRYNVLFDKQFGFRQKFSTSHATAFLSSKLHQNMENSEKSICVFMDLSKAFDTINIDILIEKLCHYGVRGVANDWFCSYLTNRLQFVKIGSSNSENICQLLHGVPQGSILGPLLFSIYINDFTNCLKFGEAIMFADDTTLVFHDKDVTKLKEEANSDLLSAADWLSENKLSLNIKKTNYMFFNPSKSVSDELELNIMNEKIDKVTTQKFLGVIFDNKLQWKDHINHIISKLNSCLGACRRALPFLSHSALYTIYHSLMQSHIDYCNTTWGAWEPRGNKTILQRLQAVSNNFFRMTYRLDNTASVRNILKSHGILNVFQNYDYKVCQTMHKAVNGDLPPILSRVITFENNFFFFKNCRIKKTERSIVFAGPRLWNNLPSELVEESSFNKFKTLLKDFIINRI